MAVEIARPRVRRGMSRISNVVAGFEKDPRRGFESPRDFCMAVMAHGSGNVRATQDQRLRFLASAGSDEQGTYSEPYGGFLVPVGFHPEMMALTPEDDPVGGRTTKIPMEVPRVEVPARTDKNHSTGSVTGRPAKSPAARRRSPIRPPECKWSAWPWWPLRSSASTIRPKSFSPTRPSVSPPSWKSGSEISFRHS